MHQTNDFVGFKNRRFFIKTQCHEKDLRRFENTGNKLL